MKNYRTIVSKHFTEKVKLSEVLQKISKLDLSVVRDAALKGAVWIQKEGRGKILRIRSVETLVNPNDSISFYYDSRVLSIPELKSVDLVFENSHYGIWNKPAGIVPQGTQAGDHSSLLRYVEKHRKKEVYLVHRLDRETEGLMIVGYTSEAARLLSDLFQKNKIKKIYQAIILGEVPKGHKQTINASLEDKEAITHFEVLDSKNGQSLLSVQIDTGRLHQIRRHLDGIGLPIMGDPKYGKGNKNREGLKLLAYSVSFTDPWTKQVVNYQLDKGLSF